MYFDLKWAKIRSYQEFYRQIQKKIKIFLKLGKIGQYQENQELLETAFQFKQKLVYISSCILCFSLLIF